MFWTPTFVGVTVLQNFAGASLESALAYVWGVQNRWRITAMVNHCNGRSSSVLYEVQEGPIGRCGKPRAGLDHEGIRMNHEGHKGHEEIQD